MDSAEKEGMPPEDRERHAEVGMLTPRELLRPLRLPPDAAVDELAQLFRLLGDPSRLRIVAACLNERVCVSDIAEATALSPSLVSHHLRLLRSARVVRAERRGKQIFYTAADEHVRRMIGEMFHHVVECEVPAVDTAS